jgi:hypothetical protein
LLKQNEPSKNSQKPKYFYTFGANFIHGKNHIISNISTGLFGVFCGIDYFSSHSMDLFELIWLSGT